MGSFKRDNLYSQQKTFHIPEPQNALYSMNQSRASTLVYDAYTGPLTLLGLTLLEWLTYQCLSEKCYTYPRFTFDNSF